MGYIYLMNNHQKTNKSTAVDHSGNNTVLRIKGMYTFERGQFYKCNYFLLWTT